MKSFKVKRERERGEFLVSSLSLYRIYTAIAALRKMCGWLGNTIIGLGTHTNALLYDGDQFLMIRL